MGMDAQTRLKLTIGDLLMQVALLSEKIEKLEEELAEAKKTSQDVLEKNTRMFSVDP